jgi:hypothetical protein
MGSPSRTRTSAGFRPTRWESAGAALFRLAAPLTCTGMTIVRYAHRYKRPPRKKAQAAAITGPAIVKAKKPTPQSTRAAIDADSERDPAAAVPQMLPDGSPEYAAEYITRFVPRPGAIVTAKHPSKIRRPPPEASPEVRAEIKAWFDRNIRPPGK